MTHRWKEDRKKRNVRAKKNQAAFLLWRHSPSKFNLDKFAKLEKSCLKKTQRGRLGVKFVVLLLLSWWLNFWKMYCSSVGVGNMMLFTILVTLLEKISGEIWESLIPLTSKIPTRWPGGHGRVVWRGKQLIHNSSLQVQDYSRRLQRGKGAGRGRGWRGCNAEVARKIETRKFAAGASTASDLGLQRPLDVDFISASDHGCRILWENRSLSLDLVRGVRKFDNVVLHSCCRFTWKSIQTED